MTDFYSNKYPIQTCIQTDSGEWGDLPEGNIFTIRSIQNDFFVLDPVSEIKNLVQISVGISMLDRGFTKSERVK